MAGATRGEESLSERGAGSQGGPRRPSTGSSPSRARSSPVCHTSRGDGFCGAGSQSVELSRRALGVKKSRQEMDMLCSSYGFHDRQLEPDEDQVHVLKKRTATGKLKASLHTLAFWLVNTASFQVFFCVLVVLNVCSLLFQAHFVLEEIRTGEDYTEMKQKARVAENVFIALFVVELLFRTIGSPIAPWRDSWLVADAVIVGLAALEEWVLLPLSDSQGSGEDHALRGMAFATLLRMLRLLRTMRALRVLRMFRMAKQLRLMAEVLGSALVTTLWISILVPAGIGCIAASLAILYEGELRAFYSDHQSEPLLDGIFYIMVTLLMVTLHGMEWSPVLDEGWDIQPTLWLLLLAYILFALVCLLNLIMGTFVASILVAKKADSQLLRADAVAQFHRDLYRLRVHFQNMDLNLDGVLSMDEFQDGLDSDPELCAALGLDPDKATALYRMAVKTEGAAANVDDLLMAVLKEGKMSVSVDMLSLDRGQVKQEAKVTAIADDYDRGMTAVAALIASLEGEFGQDTPGGLL